MLKPHDILCVLKISCLAGTEWTLRELGKMIGVAGSEAYNSSKRLKASGLIYEASGEVKIAGRRLVDFIVYGVPAVYYPERGQLARGMVTGASAPPLSGQLQVFEGDIPLVWPIQGGKTRGETLIPIYKTAPVAAASDPRLYELLVLVDALRTGRAKEKKLAAEILEERFVGRGHPAEKAVS
jgi:hypothetical protein